MNELKLREKFSLEIRNEAEEQIKESMQCKRVRKFYVWNGCIICGALLSTIIIIATYPYVNKITEMKISIDQIKLLSLAFLFTTILLPLILVTLCSTNSGSKIFYVRNINKFKKEIDTKFIELVEEKIKNLPKQIEQAEISLEELKKSYVKRVADLAESIEEMINKISISTIPEGNQKDKSIIMMNGGI